MRPRGLKKEWGRNCIYEIRIKFWGQQNIIWSYVEQFYDGLFQKIIKKVTEKAIKFLEILWILSENAKCIAATAFRLFPAMWD